MRGLLLALFLLWAIPASAQPATPCTPNQGSWTFSTTTYQAWVCDPAGNSWHVVNAATAYGMPSGALMMLMASTCPANWTEVTALNGKMLRGTVAANGNVGTTGGSDTYTPAGTVTAPVISWPAGVPTFAGASGIVPAQTFTGSGVTTSAVTAGTPAGTNSVPTFTGNSATSSAVTAGTPAGTISALTTGADSSTTGGVAKAIAQTPTFTGSALATHTHTTTATGTVTAPTFTGSALAAHTHTLTATGSNATVNFTPTGTIAWPVAVPTNTAPAFTGTQATVVPAYVNVIFCAKS